MLEGHHWDGRGGKGQSWHEEVPLG